MVHFMQIRNEAGIAFESLTESDKVRCSLALIGRELRLRFGRYSEEVVSPSVESPLDVSGDRSESETCYLWTAAYVFGMFSDVKFEANAIRTEGYFTKFEPKQQLSLIESFRSEAIYHGVFKQHFKKSMLQIPTRAMLSSVFAKEDHDQRERELEKQRQISARKVEVERQKQRLQVEEKRKIEDQRREAERRATLEEQGRLRAKLQSDNEKRMAERKAEQEEQARLQAQIKIDNERKEAARKADCEDGVRRKTEVVEAHRKLLTYCEYDGEDGPVRTSFIAECLSRCAGAHINLQDSNGNTPLMIALEWGNHHLAEMLLDKNADVTCTNKKGLSAADYVSKSTTVGMRINKQLKKSLYIRRADNPPIQKLNKELLRLVGSLSAEPRKIKILLHCGAQINCKDKYGYTPLMIVASNQNDRIAEYLLGEGADPSLKNNFGEQAIDLVAKDSQICELLRKGEFAKRVSTLPVAAAAGLKMLDYVGGYEVLPRKIDEFLEAGAKIDCQNSYGFTALMVAIEKGNEEIAEYLLMSGANPLVKDIKGKVASDYTSRNSTIYQIIKGCELLLATRRGDLVAADALLSANEALINIQGPKGYTCLLAAVENSLVDMVEFYLGRQANMSILCDDGCGVFDLVTNDKIFELLKMYYDQGINNSESDYQESLSVVEVGGSEQGYSSAGVNPHQFYQAHRAEYDPLAEDDDTFSDDEPINLNK
tara:strand:+ start:4612 stop:6744 length:2133 start_codon:yes stop_codon:yes gene_type:complete